MGPPILLQDHVVELLHAHADSGDAVLMKRPELGFGQGAGGALECDFVYAVPGKNGLEPYNKIMELLFAQDRRRSTSKVNEVQPLIAQRIQFTVHLELSGQGAKIGIDSLRSRVCI